MPKDPFNLDFSFDLDSGIGSDEPDTGPLAGIEYEGSVEKDSPKELSALQAAFKAKVKAEQQRFVDATDSEFWFALCFQTRAQKEAFLRAMEWIVEGDKYLDGVAIAAKLSISLPDADVRHQGEKSDRKIAQLPRID